LLYDHRASGQRVTVASADGGSPVTMVETTYQKYRHVSFDRCYLLLDEDVAISQQVRDKARKWHIQLVISTPHCLEGMLLIHTMQLKALLCQINTQYLELAFYGIPHGLSRSCLMSA
jgi:diaminopimelate decarboxylase